MHMYVCIRSRARARALTHGCECGNPRAKAAARRAAGRAYSRGQQKVIPGLQQKLAEHAAVSETHFSITTNQ